jgi:hypothetical protein
LLCGQALDGACILCSSAALLRSATRWRNTARMALLVWRCVPSPTPDAAPLLCTVAVACGERGQSVRERVGERHARAGEVERGATRLSRRTVLLVAVIAAAAHEREAHGGHVVAVHLQLAVGPHRTLLLLWTKKLRVRGE